MKFDNALELLNIPTSASPDPGYAKLYSKSGTLWLRNPDASERIVGGEDTGWIGVTFQSGWGQYAGWDTCSYRRKNGIVYIRGLCAGGAVGSTIFTLPVGFRPAGNQHASVPSYGGSGILNLFADGTVNLNTGNGGYVSLQVPPFPADN